MTPLALGILAKIGLVVLAGGLLTVVGFALLVLCACRGFTHPTNHDDPAATEAPAAPTDKAAT